MTRRSLQGRQSLAFGKLGTMRDMQAVARKMAQMRSAVQAMQKLEVQLQEQAGDKQRWRPTIENIVEVTTDAGQWSHEAADILRNIKAEVEQYLRDLKNATD